MKNQRTLTEESEIATMRRLENNGRNVPSKKDHEDNMKQLRIRGLVDFFGYKIERLVLQSGEHDLKFLESVRGSLQKAYGRGFGMRDSYNSGIVYGVKGMKDSLIDDLRKIGFKFERPLDTSDSGFYVTPPTK